MREAGQRVQPNLSRFTVASIIRTFREENRTQRRPPGGGRLRLLSEEQERELVNMVIANNVIRLREIQRRVIEDDHHFRGINAISLSTIDRILRKNQFRMKQVYRVPFERNSDRVKNQRVEYVQRMFEIEGRPVPHEIIFVDEAATPKVNEEAMSSRAKSKNSLSDPQGPPCMSHDEDRRPFMGSHSVLNLPQRP
ncbi:hypothetical protein QQF64_012010 [Cirrhinus molitorella]|uniref:Transposase n=1 Tax=Cirrhinus molitorella TaxID=172907 RepID=A0ABR3LVV0_9TELE